jgi:hypothetical protein
MVLCFPFDARSRTQRAAPLEIKRRPVLCGNPGERSDKSCLDATREIFEPTEPPGPGGSMRSNGAKSKAETLKPSPLFRHIDRTQWKRRSRRFSVPAIMSETLLLA